MKRISYIDLCNRILEDRAPKRIQIGDSGNFIYEWSNRGDYRRVDSDGRVFRLNAEFYLYNLVKGNRHIYIITDLDDAEQRYLSGIIRPFRDKVRTITKVENKGEYTESIIISFRHDVAMIVLPPFPKGKMYTLMETGRRYTVEELGL